MKTDFYLLVDTVKTVFCFVWFLTSPSIPNSCGQRSANGGTINVLITFSLLKVTFWNKVRDMTGKAQRAGIGWGRWGLKQVLSEGDYSGTLGARVRTGRVSSFSSSAWETAPWGDRSVLAVQNPDTNNAGGSVCSVWEHSGGAC